jgi:hypothetical protein
MLLKSEFGPEVPCARCQRRVRGIRWGDVCRDCRAEMRARAAPRAQRIALFVTVAVAALVWLTLPAGATRVWVAAVIVATYLVARRIATSLLVEYMPLDTPTAPDASGDVSDDAPRDLSGE